MGWLGGLGTTQLVLLVLGGLLVLLVAAALLTRVLVKVGLRTPWVIRLLNRLRDRIVGLVKRPVTIMVLDEVAAVIQTGHYTQNISDALLENHDQLKSLVAEKVAADPNTRLVSKIPGYDTVVSETTEMVMRVLIDMLSDPRTDELVSDLLRNNLQQIKRAVRDRDHEAVDAFDRPDELSPTAQQLRDREPARRPRRADRRWGSWGT
ncbi:hypothetical protein [Nocardioides marmoribigeumensis]|uniref:Uncharacterized membrane protein YheB (UPF0754 family) n=1 Tax=Nocardioides marmoribigeumensis TaxID=433649 RepID=A0ABU2C0S1_9ACTN|nr:hypothetical protein [Nocardioides marmoribigeumensis]MDR7364258.1 uncharacterized membrane protein YheB (UPF0754 family) [Nocardioides marmoribigeumensis]